MPLVRSIKLKYIYSSHQDVFLHPQQILEHDYQGHLCAVCISLQHQLFQKEYLSRMQITAQDHSLLACLFNPSIGFCLFVFSFLIHPHTCFFSPLSMIIPLRVVAVLQQFGWKCLLIFLRIAPCSGIISFHITSSRMLISCISPPAFMQQHVCELNDPDVLRCSGCVGE